MRANAAAAPATVGRCGSLTGTATEPPSRVREGERSRPASPETGLCVRRRVRQCSAASVPRDRRRRSAPCIRHRPSRRPRFRVVPINRRAGSPRHDADGRHVAFRPLRAPALARVLGPVVTFRCSVRRATVARAAVLDPIVVTASRTPQRLIDLVADVTVIDARRDRARRRQGLVATAAAAARRRDRAERRTRRDGRRVPARRERRADARAVDGMRVASASSGAPRSRRFRPTRSSASRYCAGPHRACTAPMRSAA